MNIAIFEDNRDFAGRLETLIRQYTHYPTVVNTSNESEFTQQVSLHEAILCFLDIVKGEETAGFRLAQTIGRQSGMKLIVFLTAYENKIIYNPEYKVKAFSYILKSNPHLDEEIKSTITLAQRAFAGNCLLIHAGRSETLYLPYHQINYIEAVKGKRKACIYCTNSHYIINQTLPQIMEQLGGKGFVRVHRSYVANTNNVIKQKNSDKYLHFENGSTCPYSYRGGMIQKL